MRFNPEGILDRDEPNRSCVSNLVARCHASDCLLKFSSHLAASTRLVHDIIPGFVVHWSKIAMFVKDHRLVILYRISGLSIDSICKIIDQVDCYA